MGQRGRVHAYRTRQHAYFRIEGGYGCTVSITDSRSTIETKRGMCKEAPRNPALKFDSPSLVGKEDGSIAELGVLRRDPVEQ